MIKSWKILILRAKIKRFYVILLKIIANKIVWRKLNESSEER
jgi:hypothetical protein